MSEDDGAIQQQESIELKLGEKGDSKDPSVIKQMIEDLKENLPEICSEAAKGGKRWWRGKSEQECARAQEILSITMERIGRLSLDEQKQRHEQRLDSEKHEQEIRHKEEDQYFAAVERTVKIVKDLIEMGVDPEFAMESLEKGFDKVFKSGVRIRAFPIAGKTSKKVFTSEGLVSVKGKMETKGLSTQEDVPES